MNHHSLAFSAEKNYNYFKINLQNYIYENYRFNETGCQ